MTYTELEQATIDYYERTALEWDAQHRTDRYWREAFDKFGALLPRPAKIIEVGCGGGRDALTLVKEFSFDYVGTDISARMLEQARINLPGSKFVQSGVYDLASHFPAGEFDGFWSAACLLHIPRQRMPAALAAIRYVLKENGVGFISLKRGDGEEVDQETGRFFSYYQPDDLKTIITTNGLEVLEMYEMMSNHTVWVISLLRKMSRTSP